MKPINSTSKKTLNPTLPKSLNPKRETAETEPENVTAITKRRKVIEHVEGKKTMRISCIKYKKERKKEKCDDINKKVRNEKK